MLERLISNPFNKEDKEYSEYISKIEQRVKNRDYLNEIKRYLRQINRPEDKKVAAKCIGNYKGEIAKDIAYWLAWVSSIGGDIEEYIKKRISEEENP